MIYLVGAIALLVLVYGLMGVKIVHQGFHYTIEHFGRYTTTATPDFSHARIHRNNVQMNV